MSRSASKSTTTSRQPSKAAVKQVAAAFDPAVLAHICTTDDFSLYANKTDLPGFERFYWYQDNGSDVLAVAHLDHVQDDGTCQVIDTAAGPLAVSGALDDRLGAYVILELLPALGIRCDILLTTDEEIGRSTAHEFAEDFTGGSGGKQYHWIIQFDRGGTDVVMYQYETGEYAAMVEEAGARVGIGSYSDIADLEALGCAAYNWGVGYEDYHSPRAHAWLNDTFRMVARFEQFYEANASTFLPHEPYRQDDDSWLTYGLDWIEADCGHDVNLSDESTYREFAAGQYVTCAACDPNN